MATTIITKNGSGAPLASDLVAGELAVDLTNGRLYTEDSGGSVIELGLTPSGNVDINGGAIDGTTVGAASASTGAFTTLTASTSLNIASSTTVDGVLDEDNMASDSASKLATQQSIKAYVDSQIGANNELSEVLSNGNTTGGTDISVSSGDDITFADNSKAIFGDDSDLEIYSDGSISRLDSTSASLAIKAPQFVVQDATGAKNMVWVPQNGGAYEVQLSHDGSTKLTTTATGIDVTGSVTADGLQVTNTATTGTDQEVASFRTASGGGLVIRSSDLSAANPDSIIEPFFDERLKVKTNGNDRLLISNNGDISFYEDTGTTAKFFWDASAESLGIGTSSPASGLELEGVGNATNVTLDNTTASTGRSYSIRSGNTGNLDFYDNDATTARVTINSSGNVGIGTSSPSTPLHVSTSAENVATFASTDTAARIVITDGTDTGYVNVSSGKVSLGQTLGLSGNNLNIDASGNVGIGTTSPVAALDVVGQVAVEGTGEYGIFHSGSASPLIGFESGSNLRFGSVTSKTASGFAEYMRIDSSGNVGIGESSPTFDVQIRRAAEVNLGLSYTGQTTSELAAEASAVTALKSSGNLRFVTNTSTEAMRIDNSGRVGIGTTTPDNKFHVVAGAAGEVAQFTGAIEARGLSIRSETNTDASAHVVFNSQSGGSKGMFTFETDGIERMQIDENGNVGIGTDSPARLLDLETTTANESYLRISGSAGNVADTNFAGIEFYNLDSSAAGPNVASFIEARAETSTGAGGELVFATLPSTASEGARAIERLRIDASGNVGIGTTSPSNALEVVGNAGNTVARFYNLAAATSLLQFQDTGTTTRPRIGSVGNDLILDTANTERLRIDSSGNVGIGTTSPAYDLTIGDGTGSTEYISIESSTTGISGVLFGDTTPARGGILYNNSDNSLAFRTATNTERMRIDSSGNLLVGTTDTDPASNNVNGFAVSSDGVISASKGNEAAANFSRRTSDGDIVVFKKGGTTVGSIGVDYGDNLFISGNSTHAGLMFDAATIWPYKNGDYVDATVDLGVDGGRFKDLYLSSSVDLRNSTATSVDFTDTDTAPGVAKTLGEITWTDSHSSYGNTGIKLEGKYSAAGMHSFVLKTNDFSTPANLETRLIVDNTGFQIYDGAGSEAARVDSSGNLLVGCTSQPDASNFGGFINPVGQFRSSRNSTSAATQFSFNNPNGEVGTIVTNGSATAYNTSSDQRLKDNIVDAPSASDDIDAIQVRSFDWKADGSHQKYGMVAQELQTVAPEAVSAPDDPEEMMGVDYSKLVPMLIKEVQQLRARVAQLEGAN